MTLAENVVAALTAWLEQTASVTPVAGGWNSSTWLVTDRDTRYVAKLVDHADADGLTSSLRVAEFAAARGLACGPPLRTRGGELAVTLNSGVLVLLTYVPGAPPDLSVQGQVRRAGRVLAQAHQLLGEFPGAEELPYQWPWEWVPRCLDTIAMPPDLRAAALRAWGEVVDAAADHELTIGIIHADPGPDAFRLNNAGQDALIDWATTLRGPFLYDLASFAVTSRHAGPRSARWFCEGYAEQMPQIGPQLTWLDCLIKARWVANAIYFASRIERGITRGPGAVTANQDGLADAYDGLLRSR